MPLSRHPRIRDSLGRPRTLAAGPESFEFLAWSSGRAPSGANAAGDGAVLLLGLGPFTPDAARLVEGNTAPAAGEDAAPVPLAARRQVAWVECPDFERALAENGLSPSPPPPHWVRLDPGEAVAFAAETKPAVWTYRQARRLFPDFWAPLFGRLEAGAAAAPGPNPASRVVLLPGGPRDLLHLELWDALGAEGWQPLVPPPPGRKEMSLARRLEDLRPAFCLSVNLRGLDPGGEAFHLLEALGVPVALWFVDNPWHILSSLRLPWWKKATLFVTDATFLPGLRQHGAARVFPLPLAASPLFRPRSEPALPKGTRVLFAGRSAFPRRDAFFGAARPTGDLMRRARTLLEDGGRPDFHWWTAELDLPGLWPGHAVREAGAGAESCSLRHRALWLERLAPAGLAVVGDKGWKTLLPSGPPEPSLLPPVDYYGLLPGLYRAAPYTFNATSLLLPGGLTQRHFDVWSAGGFLLTTSTAGLEIFPSELVAPVLLDAEHTPQDCMARLDRQPALRRELQEEWRKLLAESHTYQHRIRLMHKYLAESLDGNDVSL